ncbi:MAG: VWA domain-containing protein [Maricaulaceae bacterium]
MLTQYARNNSGNFSIMMGVSATVLLMAAGAAVDVSGMYQQKSTMQDYADAAVLTAARTLETDVAILEQAAQDSVNANNTLENTITTGLQVFPEHMRAELSAQYSTSIMNIFGIDNLNINVAAEAPRASNDPLNLSLVLDVTGSMQGSNIAALKVAANDLVNTLEQFDNDNVRISVVPFANYVNVGTPNLEAARNKPWMNVPDDYEIVHDEVCSMQSSIVAPELCTTTTQSYSNPPTTTYNDGIPTTHPGSSGTHNVTSCPPEAYGEPEEYCYIPPPTPVVWNGCAGSRNSPWHKRAEYDNHKVPGIMQIHCGVPMLPLTNNFNSVRSKINSLQATGETYIPSGLQWGWRAIHATLPFNEASSNQGLGLKKALVLMTDGKNTRSLDTPEHDGSNGAAADALSAQLCEAIKDDDIIVYTIGYKFPGGSSNATKQMLKDCASQPENFYYADNANELSIAFGSIAANLVSVRLSG